MQHLQQLIPTFIIHTLGSFWWGSHYDIMCEKLHIWINYGGVFPSNLPILQFGYCFFYPNYLCVNNEDINCINSSPKMSFLMLLQISLKFWQMCKNSLAIISRTPQFFIRHVNNTGGRLNCLWSLTSRLTGPQAWCELALKKLKLNQIKSNIHWYLHHPSLLLSVAYLALIYSCSGRLDAQRLLAGGGSVLCGDAPWPAQYIINSGHYGPHCDT